MVKYGCNWNLFWNLFLPLFAIIFNYFKIILPWSSLFDADSSLFLVISIIMWWLFVIICIIISDIFVIICIIWNIANYLHYCNYLIQISQIRQIMQIIESFLLSSSLILNARGDAAAPLWAVELRQHRNHRAPYRRCACPGGPGPRRPPPARPGTGGGPWLGRPGTGPDHDRGPRQVEASLSRPVPAQPRVGEARTACVAQNHACLLEEEVAEEEVAAAATPLLKYKYHNIYFM